MDVFCYSWNHSLNQGYQAADRALDKVTVDMRGYGSRIANPSNRSREIGASYQQTIARIQWGHPMKTFIHPKAFEKYPKYWLDRRATLAALDMDSIDEPIVDLVAALADLPCCFPLQSCFGHFICGPDQDSLTLNPIPTTFTGLFVRYRIAYIALCIEPSDRGRIFLESLATMPAFYPAYCQMGSALWFWERYVNSYVLQITPTEHMLKDEVILDADQARHVQAVRDQFFAKLSCLVLSAVEHLR